MLTYRITVVLANNMVKKFVVCARNSDQARKFGLRTARMMCKNSGIRSKILSIDVCEFYDVD